MTRSFPLLAVTLVFFVALDSAKANIMFLDFESGPSVGYSTSIPEFINNDWFSRARLSDLPASETVVYNNIQGSFFFSAYDIDDGGLNNPQQSLFIDDINIANFTDLSLDFFVAEDDDGSNQDWDSDDFFRVFASIDNGAQFQIFGIESSDAISSNTEPRVDTNLDGVGDGTPITATFANFLVDLGVTGSELDLEFRFRFSANDEDLAIDSIRLQGLASTPIPEPGTFALAGFCLAGCGVVRYRRRKITG